MNRLALALSVLAILSFNLFAQNNPVPAVDQPLTPDHALLGSSAVTLTVNGSNFVSGSVVNWNGSALATTFVNKGELQAVVPASDLVSAATASITVSSPAPGGGLSNAIYFPVANPNAKFNLAMSDQSIVFGLNSIIVGDYNRDGKADIAVAGFTAGTYIYLGNGDGTFQAPITAQGCQVNTPQSIAQGDFNGDGILDLVTTDADGSSFCVALGKGDGTFNEAVGYNGTRFGEVIAVGDFNGDGKLDLVQPDFVNNSADVFLGNGNGTFPNIPIEYPAGIEFPFYQTVGDFNGDGMPDIAVSNGGFSVLLGDGSGGFEAPIVNTASTSLGQLWAADVNHDGKLDLIAVNLGNSATNIAVLLGNGDGTFQPEADYAVPAGLFAITVGDFNGDGILDLASISSVSSGGFRVQPPGTVSYLFGNGDGTFSPAVNYFSLSGSNAIAAADFNNDGLMDVTVSGGLVSTYVQTTLAVSSLSLNFPLQTLNSSGAPKPVKLTNKGTQSVSIHSISFGGVNATSFSQTNHCGTLAPNASCSIAVTFKPNTVPNGFQQVAATLNINSTDPPQSVNLSGAVSALSISPATLNFGTVAVGQTSTPMSLTLKNLYTFNEVLDGGKFAGADRSDFHQTTNCPEFLDPNATCTISITFTPSATGSRSATWTALSEGTNSPIPAMLSGTGR